MKIEPGILHPETGVLYYPKNLILAWLSTVEKA
jgi:hypothetical protein